MNLQDVFVIENLTILNEGKSGGPLKIRGIFQRADEANHNNRIYPRKVLENQVGHLANAIVERRLVGELDHPTYEMVKLSNASHLITGLRLQGNEVIGEAEILPTPAGKVVEGLIRGGVKIGISSRGMGTLSEGRNGTKTVNEDFKLVTFDIVADPSTRGAFPTLSESRELKKDKKIIESTIKSVVGERYFLKLLEKKIDQKLSEGKVKSAAMDDGITGNTDDENAPPPPHIQAKLDAAERARRKKAAIEREIIAADVAAKKAAAAKMDTASVIVSKKQGQSEILEGNHQGKSKKRKQHGVQQPTVDTSQVGGKPYTGRRKADITVTGGQVKSGPGGDIYEPFEQTRSAREIARQKTLQRRAAKAARNAAERAKANKK